jgi:hypothetical protein
MRIIKSQLVGIVDSWKSDIKSWNQLIDYAMIHNLLFLTQSLMFWWEEESPCKVIAPISFWSVFARLQLRATKRRRFRVNLPQLAMYVIYVCNVIFYRNRHKYRRLPTYRNRVRSLSYICKATFRKNFLSEFWVWGTFG